MSKQPLLETFIYKTYYLAMKKPSYASEKIFRDESINKNNIHGTLFGQ